MRRVGSFLLVPFVAIAALLSNPADASSQTFKFRVCNHSDFNASLAIAAHPSPGDDRFLVKGWFNVSKHSCEWIGEFTKGWFYYHAEERDRQRIIWEGKDIQVCVRHPGPWERINTTGYTCRSDEVLRGFAAEFIAAGTFVFTLNLD
jgi:uncharacterized membrane protein